MKLLSKGIKSLLTIAFLMGCLSAAAAQEVRKDKDGFLEGRDYKTGGVWVLLFVKVLPENEAVYFNYLDDLWKRQQEALKKEGVILSYKILHTNMAHKDDYSVILMTEYRDRTALDDAQQGVYDTIGRQLQGSDEKATMSFRDRAKMRQLFGGKITREIILR